MHPSILNFRPRKVEHSFSVGISATLLYQCAIFLVAVLAFVPAFDNQFVHWDDQYYVTENILVNQPTWQHLGQLWTKVVSLNYHPLTMLTLWLNSYVWGVQSATPFIITNVVLHALTSTLVFAFCHQLTKRDHYIAMTAALLFAIHPMHVESVAWVSERKDVLYAFFYFLSLSAYLKYLDGKSARWWWVALITFVGACLSKAMAVSLVPCLVLIDWYRGQRWLSKSMLIGKIPFAFIGLLTGSIAVDVQSGGDFFGLLVNTNIDAALVSSTEPDIWSQMVSTGYALWFYLSSFVMPVGMSPFHPYEADISSWYLVVLPLLVVVWLGSYKLHRTVFFGFSLFMAAIVLVLPWVGVGSAIAADRYTYIPYVGLAMVVGVAVRKLEERLGSGLVASTVIMVAGLLLYRTRMQADIWQDHATLFSQAVERYPDDSKSRVLLSAGLYTAGEYEQSVYHLEHAINQLGLHDSDAFEKLATSYSELGEEGKALAFYNYSIKLDSLNYVARYHRGLLVMDTDPQQAITDFDVCESSDFEFMTQYVHSPRAVCYGRLGRYEEAIADFTAAIDLGHDVEVNLRDRAMTYDLLGMPEEAAADRQRLADMQ